MATTYETVTVADLAETLKVTTRTIERWIQKRDLPPRVKMPGMTPYWPADLLEQWLKDRGISPLSALWAKAHGGSPCYPAIDKIDDAALAERWGIEVSTVHRLARATPFPKPMETVPADNPDDPPKLIFNLDRVMRLEHEHGNHSGLSALVQQDELEWDLDKREDDNKWNREVALDGDIA